MTLENISVNKNLITFTDWTRDDSTARITLSTDDLGHLLLALDNDEYDRVIAIAEQIKARQRVTTMLHERNLSRQP